MKNKFKQLLGILIALILCIPAMPLTGFAATESVAYIDAEEREMTCNNYKVVETSSSATTWDAGWYVVKGGTKESPITIPGVTVYGAVHLILADGCYLEVSGAYNCAGITVSGEGNSLCIYGQPEGTGELIAMGGKNAAGIGGNNNGNGENITINGGKVTATGSGITLTDDYFGGGAGIGGGTRAEGINITINGGTVNATGGTFSAGIGGGANGVGRNITITGGTVIATGNEGGAGIGGGSDASGHNITITGGKVIATGGSGTYDFGGAGGAGIGGGVGGHGVDISIIGGNIKAIGGVSDDYDGYKPASGIGGGADGGARIRTYVDKDVELRVKGTEPLTEYDIFDYDPIYSDPDFHYYDDVLQAKRYGIDVDLDSVQYAWGDRVMTAVKAGVEYQNPVYNTEKDPTSGIKEWEKSSCDSYTVVETSFSAITWNSGWYVVKGGTKENPITIPRVIVNGNVRLILTDGCYFKVSGVDDCAGITVSGEGNSLCIYGQTQGTGQLIATGGTNGAGIGGGDHAGGSNITINGGTITATGGTYGAGIGGGIVGNGSNIAINGGNITATGNKGGAGIGGGNVGSGSNITINDGNITATGNEGGAGIGGGDVGRGENLIIRDGIVRATGGNGAAGIGGGRNNVADNISIYGGIVTAKSVGAKTSGIGSGQDRDATNIYVYTHSLIRADNQDPPQTVINNNGQDLSQSFKNQENVSIIESIEVSYLDAERQPQSVRATIISKKITTMETGWYVVNSNVDINRQMIVSGDVHLILADGFTMNVQADGIDKAAIQVTNDDPEHPENSLTIYGQSDGTGTLNATGVNGGAGIGGDNGQPGSNITIYGGKIVAVGGDEGAGIGGGNCGDGSHITINGGEVRATGGKNCVGIGGGVNGNGDLITINGGKVTAIGGQDASAISKDVVIAPYLAIKAGKGEDSAAYMANTGKNLSDKPEGLSYIQTEAYISVNEGEVLIYDQAAENSVVKGTATAKVYYTGKVQTSAIMKPNFFVDTYDDILTKSDDYQNKSDTATLLSTMIKSFKRIRTNVDDTSKELLGTSSYDLILSALNTSDEGITGFKGTYYGNLNTDLWSSITLNNGDFNTDENAVIIDTVLRNIYTSDPDGKSVISGEKTSTYGDAFYNSLIAMGDLYINSVSIDKDIFTLYEGVKAHIVNFNSATLEDRAAFNEAAMNTYESGYLMVNTAMTYDLQNHINQLSAITGLQAAATSDRYSQAEKTAIKNKIAELEKTLGMSLDDAKAKHEAYIKAVQEKIEPLKEQYEKIHTLWQTSDERLQQDRLMVAGDVVYCYRNDKYYDYVLKVANVNDGVPNADRTNISDFLTSDLNKYLASVRSIFLEDDRSRNDTPFSDAASTGDLLDMMKWARERKTTLNEEIANAFIIEDDENVSAQEKAARLGIYFNGSQSASKKENIITFTRKVGYVQNGSFGEKVTMMREWRASDGVIKKSETDLDSMVLVISDANLGGNAEDSNEEDSKVVDSKGVNTGDSNDMTSWALLILISVLVLAGYGIKRWDN